MRDCRVLVVTEVRIYVVDGHYYASPSFTKTIEIYYKSFGKIILATRIVREKQIRNGFKKIDDYCCALDNIGSISDFLFRKTPPRIIKHVVEADLVVLRMHSLVSLKVYRLIRRFSKVYMTEVIGCAWDAYWNHSMVGKIIAPVAFVCIRNVIKRANYCLYVTNTFLQKRYPNNGIKAGISDVSIPCVDKPKKYDDFSVDKITMMTAAALDVKYKGQKYVIKAIGRLKRKYGIDVVYYLAGSGSDSRLRRIAEKEGVSDNVIFLGMLPREELAEYMKKADLYIQPSLQEGLPRAMVEAMSKGTVCLGSNVGGVPELLDARYIFKKRSVRAIMKAVLDVSRSGKLGEASAKNIEKSREYLAEVLDEKRRDFLGKIRKGGF